MNTLKEINKKIMEYLEHHLLMHYFSLKVTKTSRDLFH